MSATVALKHSLVMVRGKIDFFEHRYYRMTKILMSFVGQWPFMTTRTRWGFFAAIMLFSSGPTATTLMAFIKYHEDRDVFLYCIMMVSLGLFSFVKGLTLVLNSAIMLKLLNRIRTDWIVWAGEREVHILHDYAGQGRKYVNAYASGAYSALFVCAIQPVVPKIIDVTLHNNSEPGQFLFPVYIYHLDVQEYYFYIMAYMYLMGMVAMTAAVSLDSMFIGYVHHCCGIFAALGYKLESCGKNGKTGSDAAYVPKQSNMTFEYTIFTCITRHNDAIEYAKLIETTYTWMFLLTMLLRLLIVCISVFQVVARMNAPQEMVKYAACSLGFTLYVYLESYFAQTLMDHSVSIRYHVQKSLWYSMSSKAQKLLLMMMVCCNVPCHLTAGKIFIISVESFAVFLKTAMSYLTVLRSI